MVLPIIALIVIPVFLGIVSAPPFDMPPEAAEPVIVEEPDLSILYFILIGFWLLILIRMIIQLKK